VSSVRAWVILGKENTRKGSLIRSLTGLGREGWCDVTLVSGQRIHLYTRITSVNEDPKLMSRNEEDRYMPSRLVDDCVKSDPHQPLRSRFNVLMAFRLGLGVPGYEAEDYIRELAAVGVCIESIVTLGERTPKWALRCGAPCADVPGIHRHANHEADGANDVWMPTNQIGAMVRQFWGWR